MILLRMNRALRSSAQRLTLLLRIRRLNSPIFWPPRALLWPLVWLLLAASPLSTFDPETRRDPDPEPEPEPKHPRARRRPAKRENKLLAGFKGNCKRRAPFFVRFLAAQGLMMLAACCLLPAAAAA
jgi:hypothetical protein